VQRVPRSCRCCVNRLSTWGKTQHTSVVTSYIYTLFSRSPWIKPITGRPYIFTRP
jgi:hypothetical protein